MLFDVVERLLAWTAWGTPERLVAECLIIALVAHGTDHALALAGALRQRLNRERGSA